MKQTLRAALLALAAAAALSPGLAPAASLTMSSEQPDSNYHAANAKAFAEEDDDRPLKKIHVLRKRGVIRAYRSPVHPSARAAKNSTDAQYTKRAPKWAQQMFNNPWQSQAFSYTR